MSSKTKPAAGGIRSAGSGLASPAKNSTIVPIARAAARRYDRLRQMLLAVAEHDFRQRRLEHARYWLAYLRAARGARP